MGAMVMAGVDMPASPALADQAKRDWALPALAADSSVLANDKIRVIISGSGQLGLVAVNTIPSGSAGIL